MRKSIFSILILLFLAGVHSYAQFDDPVPFGEAPAETEKPAVTAKLVSSAEAVKPGSTFQIGVHFKMEPKWHIYWKDPGDAGYATEIKWDLPKGVSAVGDLYWPPEIEFFTPNGDDPPLRSLGYENEAMLIQTFAVAEDAALGDVSIKADIIWLGCKVLCVPGEAKLEWKGSLAATAEADEAGQKLIQTWLSKTPSAEGTPTVKAETPKIPLVRIILMALVFGVVMNLMPCVWPVLSIKIVSFVEQSGEGRKAWHHGLSFALGIIFTFLVFAGIVLGVRRGGEELGWGFQLSSPTFVVLLTFLMFLLALNFFGVFEFGTSMAGVGQGRKTSGLIGSFLSGMLATVVATPCTGPFMGLYIGYALTQPAIVVVLFFLLLGVGMGLPYLLLTSFPALLKKIPKPGRWMETLKQGMGFILMVYVVFLVYTVSGLSGADGSAFLLFGLVAAGFAAWILGRWATFEFSGRTRIIARLAFLIVLLAGVGVSLGAKAWLKSSLEWQPYNSASIAAERSAGKPVFVSFTATWCTTCKTNKLAFTDGVEKRFTELNVATFEADWTKQPPELTAILEKHGRKSVPFYLLYPADPSKEPIVLPEVLTPGVLQGALDKLETPK